MRLLLISLLLLSLAAFALAGPCEDAGGVCSLVSPDLNCTDTELTVPAGSCATDHICCNGTTCAAAAECVSANTCDRTYASAVPETGVNGTTNETLCFCEPTDVNPCDDDDPCTDNVVETVNATCVCSYPDFTILDCDDSNNATTDFQAATLNNEECRCYNVELECNDENPCTPDEVTETDPGEFECEIGTAIYCDPQQGLYCLDGTACTEKWVTPAYVPIFQTGTPATENVNGVAESADCFISDGEPVVVSITTDEIGVLADQGSIVAVSYTATNDTSGYTPLGPGVVISDDSLFAATLVADEMLQAVEYYDADQIITDYAGLLVDGFTDLIATRASLTCVPDEVFSEAEGGLLLFDLCENRDPDTCECDTTVKRHSANPVVYLSGLLIRPNRTENDTVFNIEVRVFPATLRRDGCTAGVGYWEQNTDLLTLPGSPYAYELTADPVETRMKKPCVDDVACRADKLRIAVAANIQDGTAYATPEIIDALTNGTDALLALAPGEEVVSGDPLYTFFLELAVVYKQYLDGTTGPGACDETDEHALVTQAAYDELMALYEGALHEQNGHLAASMETTEGLLIAMLVIGILSLVFVSIAGVFGILWCAQSRAAAAYSPLAASRLGVYGSRKF